MIVTCVYINVKPEFVQQFIEASEANHDKAILEPGNIRFDVIQQVDDPCWFMLYEAYESELAAAAHKETAHYATWRDTVAKMMSEPRRGVKYNMLKPSNITEVNIFNTSK